MKYQLRMYYADALQQTAGSKATRDCSEILSSLGYQHFDVPVYGDKHPLQNLLQLIKHVFALHRLLKAGDQVLLQYPLLGINKYLKYFVALLRHKGCKLICLVHDLDALRQVHHAWTLKQEVSRLQAFDLVIVHNAKMRALLKQIGLQVEMRTLNLFDYLLPKKLQGELEQRHARSMLQQEHYAAGSTVLPGTNLSRVAFAGNLGKSVFLKQLDQLQGISFILYGPGFEQLPGSAAMEWAGSFHSDELPLQLDAAFGLIWDGDAIDTCKGYLGEYLQYNNPHKASLYLLAGLPLIAPKRSAIGDLIQEKGIGITVSSLLELPEVLRQLTAAEYWRMKSATLPLSTALASGAFLKQAVSES